MRFGIALASALIGWTAASGTALAQGACADPSKLGVTRTVEIDTTGGPGFGFDHYKAYDFLRLKEVVLTFDDGPQERWTRMILEALAAQCTKATFFTVGKMISGLPEILRDVAKGGHTIGTHTWSHKGLYRFTDEAEWKAEIEKTFSAARRAAGEAGPIAPFFRFPELKDTKETLDYLKSRNIAVFSTDIDSWDFQIRNPDALVKRVMEKLEKKTKGILLMHDIQPTTAKAMPKLLAELKTKGYKIVHLKPKANVTTLAQYDTEVEKSMKGMGAGSDRPMASVIRTIEEASPPPSAKK